MEVIPASQFDIGFKTEGNKLTVDCVIGAEIFVYEVSYNIKQITNGLMQFVIKLYQNEFATWKDHDENPLISYINEIIIFYVPHGQKVITTIFKNKAFLYDNFKTSSMEMLDYLGNEGLSHIEVNNKKFYYNSEETNEDDVMRLALDESRPII